MDVPGEEREREKSWTLDRVRELLCDVSAIYINICICLFTYVHRLLDSAAVGNAYFLSEKEAKTTKGNNSNRKRIKESDLWNLRERE